MIGRFPPGFPLVIGTALPSLIPALAHSLQNRESEFESPLPRFAGSPQLEPQSQWLCGIRLSRPSDRQRVRLAHGGSEKVVVSERSFPCLSPGGGRRG